MHNDPPTRPGLCPNCGQEANIWNPAIYRWECSFCEWTHPAVGHLNQPKDGQAIKATVVGSTSIKNRLAQ